jgi:hypothetical protein
MGLDMYAIRGPLDLADKVGEDPEVTKQYREFKYWRKHPNLHGFMQDLWVTQEGGGYGEFNCVYLRLRPDDLDELEKAIVNKNLPHTVGFFFGESEGSPEEVAEDLEFVRDARRAIEEGDAVFYYSWW